MAKLRADLPAEDEITRGLRNMVLSKQISVWLAFAAQIFLDVHHLLRGDVDRGFDDLYDIGTGAKNTLQDYLSFSRSIKAPDTWPKENDFYLQNICRSINEWILEDALLAKKKKVTVAWGSLEDPSEAYYLLKRHPILCGVLAFHVVLKLQETGVVLVNA